MSSTHTHIYPHTLVTLTSNDEPRTCCRSFNAVQTLGVRAGAISIAYVHGGCYWQPIQKNVEHIRCCKVLAATLGNIYIYMCVAATPCSGSKRHQTASAVQVFSLQSWDPCAYMASGQISSNQMQCHEYAHVWHTDNMYIYIYIQYM